MNMFEKKPTEFDSAQNKTLTALTKNQEILIKNNNWFIEEIQSLRALMTSVSTRLGQSEKTLSSLVTEFNKQVVFDENQESRLKMLEEAKKE